MKLVVPLTIVISTMTILPLEIQPFTATGEMFVRVTVHWIATMCSMFNGYGHGSVDPMFQKI